MSKTVKSCSTVGLYVSTLGTQTLQYASKILREYYICEITVKTSIHDVLYSISLCYPVHDGVACERPA